MGTNTPGVLQKYSVVPVGKPNDGAPSYEDATVLHNTLINTASTGILSSYSIVINAGDNKKIDISSFEYQVVDNHTAPNSPTISRLKYDGIAGLTLSLLASVPVTYLAIDSNGIILQQPVPFTSEQQRDLAQIGFAVHTNNTNVERTESLGRMSINEGLDTNDLAEAIGSINQDGNQFSHDSVNGLYRLLKSVGNTFSLGINVINAKNPNFKDDPLLSDISFQYAYLDNLGNPIIEPAVQDVDLSFYVLNGVKTAVPNNKYTIQRAYYLSSPELVLIGYGQNFYDNLEDAVNAIDTEAHNTSLEKNNLRNFICGREDITGLSQAGRVQIVSNDSIGGGGVSTPFTLPQRNDRLGRRLTQSASVGNSFDPLPAKEIIFDMDQNIANLTISNDPDSSANGEVFDIIMIFDQDATGSRTVTFDAAKFEAGFDVGIPVLNGTPSTRDLIACKWNNKTNKYSFIANVRRYP